jgi:23S rRNA (uracil1939-C5)-methyltransferase
VCTNRRGKTILRVAFCMRPPTRPLPEYISARLGRQYAPNGVPQQASRIQSVMFTIEKLIYGGDGLARLPGDQHGPGKTLFVPFALAGEQVEAEITEQKPGFARGRLKSVVEPSAERVQAPCPYFERCGGCHYQHSNYRTQLEIKSEILRETLKRTAKIELPCDLQVHFASEWNYRNRTRLKVQTSPEFALGYYRFRSHELLPVEQCPISSPLINQAIGALWAKNPTAEEVREIEFFSDHADTALLIEAYCSPGTSNERAALIAEQFANSLPESKGAAVFEQPLPNSVREPKRLAAFGVPEITYDTQQARYRINAGSFFQVNRFLIDELVKLVTEGASGELALDLYAGVGLFSTVLARSFPLVIAVEASQTSFSDLRHNAPAEVKAVRATTERYLEKAGPIRPELVVVDPPRGGLGANVSRSVAKLGAPRMVYVSCDPSTLARDLPTLLAQGYRIATAHLVDLFPQTYHIESVFHLARQ